MEKITKVSASLASFEGLETVLVEIETERGFKGSATIPAGITLGSGEAKSVANAVAVQNINTIVAPKIIGHDVLEQREVDQELMYLDLTPDRSKLGVNSLMPVSIAVCRAAAAALGRELFEHIANLTKSAPHMPYLVAVMASGGSHGNNSNLLTQEFSGIFTDGGKIVEAINHLGAILKRDAIEFNQSSIGSLLPASIGDLQVFQACLELADDLGISLAFDFAKTHSSIDDALVESFISDARVKIAEDPVAEENLALWAHFTKKWGEQKIIAADDLTIGNPSLIKDAVKDGIANCLVIKINQSATISELFDIIDLIKIGGWQHIVSHRGQETPDDFIVDFAVGTGANYLKMGTPLSSVRQAKFQRFEQILNLSRTS